MKQETISKRVDNAIRRYIPNESDKMNYYEIYCEDTNGLCFTNNNFSFFVRSDKKPSIKAITRKFKKRIGKYFVNGIWACNWGNNDMNYVREEAVVL